MKVEEIDLAKYLTPQFKAAAVKWALPSKQGMARTFLFLSKRLFRKPHLVVPIHQGFYRLKPDA